MLSKKKNGIPFDVLEAMDNFGGNWRYGVYDTVHIISSKRTTEFKDFHMPESYPDFPSCVQMLQYFESYVEHFKLLPFMEFNMKIETVELPPDGEKDGSSGWIVVIKKKDGSIERRHYKGVFIANGHHAERRFPSYPGKFTGEIIHSKDYKHPEFLKGKRILVIGGGNSACDLAVEAARYGAEAHSSMTRGYYFIPRSVFGIPIVDIIRPWIPLWVQRIFLHIVLFFTVGPLKNYGLPEPDHKIWEKHPTVNSELLHFIKLGEIKPHPDIDHYENKWVIFKDGTKIEVDLIICATGYYMAIPMVSKEVIPYDGTAPLLVNGIPLHHKNLFIFGLGQARYGAGSLYTFASHFFIKLFEIQQKLQSPIAQVLLKLGGKVERTTDKSPDFITDPHASFQKVLTAQKMIPWLPTIEKYLMQFGFLERKDAKKF